MFTYTDLSTHNVFCFEQNKILLINKQKNKTVDTSYIGLSTEHDSVLVFMARAFPGLLPVGTWYTNRSYKYVGPCLIMTNNHQPQTQFITLLAEAV